MVFRVAGSTVGAGGGPIGNYGLFISSQNQTNSVANTANLVALDASAVRASGITNSAGTLTFANAGFYQIVVELSFTSTTGTNPTISTWLQQNGTNIANTAQDFQLLGGANTFQIGICNWIIQAAANDTFATYWSCSNTNVSLAYQGTLTSPVRPASPSAIIVISQV